MAIATKVLYFVGCFGFVAMLVLSWVGSFLDRHLLGFTFPSIGGETLSLSLDCDTDFEALVIAAQAYPYLYSEGDFGLAEAVVSIRLDSCLARPIVEMSRDYLMDLDTWSEKNQSLAIPGRPSRLTHYRLSDPLPVGFYPAWYTGKLTYLVKNYASLNTGQGLTHYLRCDFSLGLEPYRSFFLSDFHRGILSEAEADRIDECGLRTEFTRDIDQILSEAPIMPIRFQE